MLNGMHVNFFKRFFVEAAAELAFEEVKAETPEQFACWKERVMKYGPPRSEDENQKVRWGVYLSKLGLSKVYPLGKDDGLQSYHR